MVGGGAHGEQLGARVLVGARVARAQPIDELGLDVVEGGDLAPLQRRPVEAFEERVLLELREAGATLRVLVEQALTQADSLCADTHMHMQARICMCYKGRREKANRLYTHLLRHMP